MANDLEAWGARWNKKARAKVAYDPADDVLNVVEIATNVQALDEMLGGGFPKGRVSIIVGEPSSGKTLTTQIVMSAVQKQGGVCMFFDIERTYDPQWFRMTGVDLDPKSLLVVRPRSLEQAFDMACDALEEVKPDVLVIDSIPALVTSAQLKANMEEKDFRGVSARKMTEGVAKLTQYNEQTAVILINQLRVNMNAGLYANPESMPGGKALRFYASLLLRTRRGEWLTEKGDGLDFGEPGDEKKDARRVGYKLKWRVEKSKGKAVPFAEADADFKFVTGEFDIVSSNAALAIQKGVIRGSGGYFEVPNLEKKIHGFEALKERIREDPALHASLVAELKKRSK